MSSTLYLHGYDGARARGRRSYTYTGGRSPGWGAVGARTRARVRTLLFYLFLISLPGRNEKNVVVYNSLGKRGTQKADIDDEFGEDDDGEEIVFHTRV